jgi:hypothetical protein
VANALLQLVSYNELAIKSSVRLCGANFTIFFCAKNQENMTNNFSVFQFKINDFIRPPK